MIFCDGMQTLTQCDLPKGRFDQGWRSEKYFLVDGRYHSYHDHGENSLTDEASVLPPFVALEDLHLLAACISSPKEKPSLRPYHRRAQVESVSQRAMPFWDHERPAESPRLCVFLRSDRRAGIEGHSDIASYCLLPFRFLFLIT